MTSSSDFAELAKADQISFHFFTKTYGVLYEARSIALERGQGKVDKWFSLETTESNMPKDTRDAYKHVSTSTPPPPPLEIQVLLSVPELNNNRVLVLSPSHPLNTSLPPSPSTPIPRILISPTPKFVLLESVIVRFDKGDRQDGLEIAKMYKAGIPHFRSLYTALRILPCWKLIKSIRRRPGPGRNGLGIVVRVRPVSSPSSSSSDVLGFDMPPCPGYAPLETQLQRFPSIPHPLGKLTVEVRYLAETGFQLDERESLLSSGFAALDRIAPSPPIATRGYREEQEEEEEPFVPTLMRHQQRDSVGSLVSQRTGGSLVSQRSGVSGGERDREKDTASIAEKFVLPPRTAGWKSGSPSTAPGVVPPPALVPASQAARLRKESLGNSGVSLGSSTGGDSSAAPLPIRRPTIHPFKSSTLVSGSPGALARMIPPVGVSGSPAGKLSSSPSIRTSSSPGTRPRVAPSPVSGQFPFGSVNKPSPPFQSSSPADRTSLERERAPSRASLFDRPPSSLGSNSDRNRRVSMGSDSGARKYTSQFGHRYAGSTGSATGAAAALASIPATPGMGAERSPSPVVPGSPAGSPLPPGSPAGGRSPVVGSPLVAGRSLGASAGSGSAGTGENKGSYLSQTDDDDISAFVQHIDSRKPLSGRVKQSQQQHLDDDTIRASGKGKEKERAETAFSGSPSPSTPAAAAAATITARPSRPSPLSPFPTTMTQPRAQPASSTSPNSGGLILTSQGEVDEKLKKMTEAFMKSLDGISGSTRKRRERRGEEGTSVPPSPAGQNFEGSGGSGSGSGSGAGGGGGSGYPRRYPQRYYDQFQEEGSFASQGSDEIIGKMELDEGGAGRGRRR